MIFLLKINISYLAYLKENIVIVLLSAFQRKQYFVRQFTSGKKTDFLEQWKMNEHIVFLLIQKIRNSEQVFIEMVKKYLTCST